MFRSARWLLHVQADGQGYDSRSWKNQRLSSRFRKLPADTPIYSNGIDADLLSDRQTSLGHPGKIIHGTAQPNPDYEPALQKMSEELRQRHGVLVYFNTLSERWFLPLESE